MRPLAPKGGNDIVMTPEFLAIQILNHFPVKGRIFEPCKGSGSFYNNFPSKEKGYAEISEGIDFLTGDFGRYDWIVTNPPWSKFRPFLVKSMNMAENVVFLSLVNAFFMRARLRDIKEQNFGIKEILMLDTPPKPWPQTGFQLGATWIQKGHSGDVKISYA